MNYYLLMMFQLIISHKENGHFGLGTVRPLMGSITNSETYKMSQFSPNVSLEVRELGLGDRRLDYGQSFFS